MFQATRVQSWFVYDQATNRRPVNICGTAAETIAEAKRRGFVAPFLGPYFETETQWDAYMRHLSWTGEQAANKLAKLHEWLQEHGIVNVFEEEPKVAKSQSWSAQLAH